MPQIEWGGQRLDNTLVRVCGEWTIFARYSTLSADIRDAREFLNDVGELKKWFQ